MSDTEFVDREVTDWVSTQDTEFLSVFQIESTPTLVELTASQLELLNADWKKITWLIDISNSSTTYHFSTKEFTYYPEYFGSSNDAWQGDDEWANTEYDYRGDLVSTISLNRSKSELNMNAPDSITLKIFNSDNSLAVSEFENAEVLVQVLLGNNYFQAIVDKWRFYVKRSEKVSKQLYLELEDMLTHYLDAEYPNGATLYETFTSLNEQNDTLCTPLVFGTAYIPLRQPIINGTRKYILGHTGATYTVEKLKAPDESGGSLFPSNYDSDLCGRWKFDEGSGASLSDASLYKVTGSLTSGTWATRSTNFCLSFNGTTGYANLTNSGYFVGHRAFECWANFATYASSSTAFHVILSKHLNYGNGLYVDYASTPNRIHVAFQANDSTTEASCSLSTVSWAISNYSSWYHIVGQFNLDNEAELYINGNLVGTGSSISNNSGYGVSILGSNLLCGGGVDYRYSNLKIDDPKLFTKCLNSTEISSLYNSVDADTRRKTIHFHCSTYGSYAVMTPLIMLHTENRDETTHEGSTSLSTLYDSTASWSTDVLKNHFVVNVNDESYGIITSNTSNQIIASLLNGDNNNWEDGDVYQIFINNPTFAPSGKIIDPKVKYYKSTTQNTTNPASWIEYVLKDFGIPASYIDSASFSAAAATYSRLNIEFNGAFYYKQPRVDVLSTLLTSCDSYLHCTDVIKLYPFSTTSQATIDSSIVITKGQGGESSLSYSFVSLTNSDSGHVAFQTSENPQDTLIKSLVPAKSTTLAQDNDVITIPYIQDSQNAQIAGSLAFQKKLLKQANVSFDGFSKLLRLRPNQMITVNDANYGGTYKILIESIDISKDLIVSIHGNKYKEELDDWDSITGFSTINIEEDTITQTYSIVVSGPKTILVNTETPNKLKEYLYLGDNISLDGKNGRVHIGNSLTYGTASFNIHDQIYTSGATLKLTVGAEIANWQIRENILRSASSGTRIELNQVKHRVSVFDSTQEQVVMGYLSDLPKNPVSGNVSTASSYTIHDNSQDWTSNQFSSATLSITFGTGSGQSRSISSNTATIITISATFNTLPDSTSKYSVSGWGSWSTSDYGFWAREGNSIDIDGDVQYESGNWVISENGNILINNSSGQTILRVGSESNERGLFTYSSSGSLLTKYTSNGISIEEYGAIYVKSGGDVDIADGGDLILRSIAGTADLHRSMIKFPVADDEEFRIYSDYSNRRLCITPAEDFSSNQTALFVGYDQTGGAKRFQQIYMVASYDAEYYATNASGDYSGVTFNSDVIGVSQVMIECQQSGADYAYIYLSSEDISGYDSYIDCYAKEMELSVDSLKIKNTCLTRLGGLKNTTGDPALPDETQLTINSVDKAIKIYAGGGWRTLATWT